MSFLVYKPKTKVACGVCIKKTPDCDCNKQRAQILNQWIPANCWDHKFGTMEKKFGLVTATKANYTTCGTMIDVCNAKTGRTVTVVVVEYGGLVVNKESRILDLSIKAYVAAGFSKKLGRGEACIGNFRQWPGGKKP